MPGTNAWQVLKVPRTFTAKVRSQPSSGISHSGAFGPTTPAELTRMPTGPACVGGGPDRGRRR